MAETIDIKDFSSVSGVSDTDNILLARSSGSNGKILVSLFRSAISSGITPSIRNGYWWIGSVNQNILAEGKTPEFRKGELGIEWKYTIETTWLLLVPYTDISLRFEDLSPSQINQLKLTFNDLTTADIAVLQKPANDMIDILNQTNQSVQVAEALRVEEFNLLKTEIDSAISSAEDTANHPTYIGSDNYVYIWNKTSKNYIKTDIYAKGETGDPFTYSDFTSEQLEELKGERGYTAAFEIGTVMAGDMPSADLVQTGTDAQGNPIYSLSLVMPRGEQGYTPLFEIGQVVTLNPNESASADLDKKGTAEDGSPIYELTLRIPRGQQGLPGLGSGNVLVSGEGLVRGKKYLFSPLFDNSTEGRFYDAPEPYDDTEVLRLIGNKVEQVPGKQLTTEDFTTLLKQKLDGLSNYNDAALTSELNNLKTRLDTLIGTSASAAIDTFNEITAFLAGVTDTQNLTTLLSDLRTDIVALIPNVPSWALAAQKPTYTASEVGALATNGKANSSITADKLSTPRTIQGVAFDGTANINLPLATGSMDGLMPKDDRLTLALLNTVDTATSVSGLSADIAYTYVYLSSNSSLSVISAPRNGRELLVFVFTPSVVTITIPTTGNYVSMCGSSYTTTAGKWTEFSLVGINNQWHIAKIEQE